MVPKYELTLYQKILNYDTNALYICIPPITDVFVGSTRDALLDLADSDLSLSPVVVQFGKFLKIVVTLDVDATSDATVSRPK